MSALRGAIVGVGLLIVEEVLVTSKGGPAAVSGATGVLVGAIDRFADPTIPAIPNRSKTAPKSTQTPNSSTLDPPGSIKRAPGSQGPPTPGLG